MDVAPANGCHLYRGLRNRFFQFRQGCSRCLPSRDAFTTLHRPVPGTQIHPSAATILPRYASSVILFFAWGLKHMIAGLVLVSAAVGLVAMAAAVFLSVPAWIVLVGYPVVCSLTLLLAATFLGLRSTQAPQTAQMLRPQA